MVLGRYGVLTPEEARREAREALARVSRGKDPAAEREKARLQMAFMVAINRPRHEEEARRRILDNCNRRDFAVKAMYKKPLGGGQTAQDLSVRWVASGTSRIWIMIDMRLR